MSAVSPPHPRRKIALARLTARWQHRCINLDEFLPGSFLGFVVLCPLIAAIVGIWLFVGWLLGY